jgi:amino acid transporter
MPIVCSGGIYGNEGLLLLAPAGVVVCTLVVVAVLFAVPLGLIVTELGTALPANGGVVVWIAAAFPASTRLGLAYYVSSLLAAVSYIVDSAIYPSMAAGYITAAFFDSHSRYQGLIEAAIAQGIIVAITIAQCFGTEVLSTFSNTIALISLTPSLVWIAWAGIANVS